MKEPVAQVEKISEISRDFSYINGQVLSHVMTTRENSMKSIGEIITGRVAKPGEKRSTLTFCLVKKIQEAVILNGLLRTIPDIKRPWKVFLVQAW